MASFAPHPSTVRDQARPCRQELSRPQTEDQRRVFIFSQKRGIFGVTKRQLRRWSAIEPMIGHMKTTSTSTIRFS
jgi:hypothetical protein